MAGDFRRIDLCSWFRPRRRNYSACIRARGRLRSGSDADIVVFDPNEEMVISAKTHHMRVDYSMFEGIRVKGVAKIVLSRGRVIIENGEFKGRAGSGEFIKRRQYSGA